MKTIQESVKFPGNGVTAPFSIVIRSSNKWEHLGEGPEYVVHTRNDQNGGHYSGFYTMSYKEALGEYETRVIRALRKVA